jgi:uncharacterized membrane protein YadS
MIRRPHIKLYLVTMLFVEYIGISYQLIGTKKTYWAVRNSPRVGTFLCSFPLGLVFQSHFVGTLDRNEKKLDRENMGEGATMAAFFLFSRRFSLFPASHFSTLITQGSAAVRYRCFVSTSSSRSSFRQYGTSVRPTTLLVDSSVAKTDDTIFARHRSTILIERNKFSSCSYQHSFRNGHHPLRRSFRSSFFFFSTSNSKDQHNKSDDDLKNDKKTKPAASTATNTSDESSSSAAPEMKQQLVPEGSPLPGLVLAAGTAVSGFSCAAAISAATLVPLSGIPVAIVLGIILRTFVLPTPWQTPIQPGLTLAAKTILQSGIVCVGIKLSVWQLLMASTTSVPVVLAAVTSGMVGIPKIAQWLKLDSSSSSSTSPHLVPLMTAGTSICGVTAISALAPAIRAPPADIAVAVANTVLFGTMGMVFYPYLLHGLLVGPEGINSNSSTVVGLTLGVAIHDTSQVLGAALSYKESYGDSAAMELAAVTKLVRNLGLAAAIPYLTYQHHHRLHQSSSSSSTSSSSDQRAIGEPIRNETLSGLPTFTNIVPPFLVAFLAMSVLRSVGDVTIAETYPQLYETTVNFIGNDLSKYALGTAMAATGLSIDANSLRSVGWRPFALGGLSTLLVGSVGFYTALAVSYVNT